MAHDQRRPTGAQGLCQFKWESVSVADPVSASHNFCCAANGQPTPLNVFTKGAFWPVVHCTCSWDGLSSAARSTPYRAFLRILTPYSANSVVQELLEKWVMLESTASTEVQGLTVREPFLLVLPVGARLVLSCYIALCTVVCVQSVESCSKIALRFFFNWS